MATPNERIVQSEMDKASPSPSSNSALAFAQNYRNNNQWAHLMLPAIRSYCATTQIPHLGNRDKLVAALQARGVQPINVLQNTAPGPGASPSAAKLTANITKSLLRRRADFLKQAQGEDFEVYLRQLEIAFSHDGMSNNTKIDCLIGHTTPTVTAAAQRLYDEGYHNYNDIADWLKIQFGLLPFKHFTRFLALRPLEDESWAQFGNCLRCEYIRYLPLSATDLPSQERSITAALIGQLLAITTGGLHAHLYSKATADRTLTWVNCLAYGDKYRCMHPNTPRASLAPQNTQQGNRRPKTTASRVALSHTRQQIAKTTWPTRSHGDQLPKPGKRQDWAVKAVLCSISQDTDDSLTIIIGIKDKRVTALIDTGATRSFMVTNVAAKVGLTPHPTKAKISAAVLHISANISHLHTFVHRPGKTLTGPDALSRIQLNSIQLRNVPDPGQRANIIDQYHVEMGHTNWKKTFDTIRKRFTWPGMRTDIFHHVIQCAKCFTFNSATAAVGTKLIPVPPANKHDRLGVDFWGPFPPSTNGNRYAIVAINYYSRRVVTTPVKRATANALCSFLADVIAQLGTFEIIHSDGAAVFNSAPYKRFITANQIESYIAQPYHPKGNGACEQAIKSLSAIIAKTAPTPTTWDDILLDAAIAYNRTPHTTTGLPPIELWHKKPIPTPADIRFKLPPRDISPELKRVKVTNQRYRKRYIQQANRHRKTEFKLSQMDTEETDRPQICLDPGTLDATNESYNEAHPTTSSPKVHQACSETPNQAPAMPDRSLPRTPTVTSPVSRVNIPPFDSLPQEPTLPPQPDLTTAKKSADSPAPVAPNRQWRNRQRTSSPAAGHWHNRSTAQDPSRTTNTSNDNLTSTGSQDAQGSRPKRRRRRPSRYLDNPMMPKSRRESVVQATCGSRLGFYKRDLRPRLFDMGPVAFAPVSSARTTSGLSATQPSRSSSVFARSPGCRFRSHSCPTFIEFFVETGEKKHLAEVDSAQPAGVTDKTPSSRKLWSVRVQSTDEYLVSTHWNPVQKHLWSKQS
ncbi:unnamed protein product [Notodromas monacha]|uniref:RNA-directed DNA polymerase n=1 Tax=Notodromas monacha TaxID=399045 RepID=A0A7R9BYM5_9CRUS|nr:unnamed protein product [Notodromas monacha]CAG0923246.1 unnamed protein product [Notodromas monacha]